MLDSRFVLVLVLTATLVPAVSLAQPSTPDAAPEEPPQPEPVGPATLAEFADGPSRAVPPPPELTGLYQQVAPSVVRVKTFEGSGSGFLLGEDIVATAWHVVSECTTFVVELRDGTELDATLFSYSTRDDLAILKLERPVDAPALELAPDAPAIGGPAYAIGSPLFEDFPGLSKRHEGLLAWSFTEGMVSAVGERQVQVTASVQPGNSGGPVVDGAGRVLGVAVERMGDFGFATRSGLLRELLDEGEKKRRLPPVKVGLSAGFRFDGMPFREVSRQRWLGLDVSLNLLIDRHLMVDVGTTFNLLSSSVERKSRNPEQALDIYSRVGGSIDLPFRPGQGPHAQIQIYGVLGGTLREYGERDQTVRLRDPDCDMASEDCAVDRSDTTEWTREFNPLLGGGVRFNFGPASVGFEAATNPLAPQRDLRVGGTLGLRF